MKVVYLSRLSILRERKSQTCRQNSFRLESRIDSLQQPETLDQKSRANHEHHRNTDLKHHEHLAEAQAIRARGDRAAGLFECSVQVGLRGVPRGYQPKDHARCE